MSSFGVVEVDPLIQIGLQGFDSFVELLAECDLIKLLQDCFVEAFANPVGLGRFNLGLGVVNVVDCQEELVNSGAKLVHPGGAKPVHLTLCGTRCWGVVPVVHRRDPRCFV